jgi:hypothetical protein
LARIRASSSADNFSPAPQPPSALLTAARPQPTRAQACPTRYLTFALRKALERLVTDYRYEILAWAEKNEEAREAVSRRTVTDVLKLITKGAKSDAATLRLFAAWQSRINEIKIGSDEFSSLVKSQLRGLSRNVIA